MKINKFNRKTMRTLEKTKKEQPRTNNPEILGTRNGMRTNKIPKTNKQTNKFL
jgi:hypothetical protein